MGRNCKLCGGNGHNYRTCSEKSKTVKLFGVKISTSAISKKDSANYGRKIKKGIPWTEDEQRLFLKGLEIHGKGNWAKIGKDLLPSRTPTQIASHAQKYFMRLDDRKYPKKKPSVFDLHLQKTHENMNLEEISKETIVSEHDIKNCSTGNQDQQTANSQVVTPIAAIPTSQSIPNYYNVLPVTWIHMYDFPSFYASGIDSIASTSASGTMEQQQHSGFSSQWSANSSMDNLDLTL